LARPDAGGGPADLLAGRVAEGMGAALGQTVIVESRAGGGTTIGAASVARARPDGSTLFIGGAPSHIVAPALMKNVGYDGLKDFAPVAMVANVPNVLVVPEGARYRTVNELVMAAKESNGAMTFASAGVGSLPQFLGVLLRRHIDSRALQRCRTGDRRSAGGAYRSRLPQRSVGVVLHRDEEAARVGG